MTGSLFSNNTLLNIEKHLFRLCIIYFKCSTSEYDICSKLINKCVKQNTFTLVHPLKDGLPILDRLGYLFLRILLSHNAIYFRRKPSS